MEKTLSTKEAAKILGVNDSRVRQMILKGELPAEKFGPVWMIREEDLELVKDRPPPGYPKGRAREKLEGGGLMEEAAQYGVHPKMPQGIVEGLVATRLCPSCGHHETGVKTKDGEFQALRPGDRVLVEVRYPIIEGGVKYVDLPAAKWGPDSRKEEPHE